MKEIGTVHTTGDFNRGRLRLLQPKVGGDDRQNAFQRVNVARDRALEAEKEVEVKPESEAERIARKEANKRRWSGSEREQTTPLARPAPVANLPNAEDIDEATARSMPLSELAQVVSNASRSTVSASVASPSQVRLDRTTIAAVILQWARDHADYYDSPFNSEQFNNAMTDRFARGELFSYDLLNSIFQELRAGNHLESPPAFKRRGFTTQSAPTQYQRREVTPQERKQIDERRQAELKSEEDVARNMPLDELKRTMRSGFKDSRSADIRGTR